MANEKKKGSSRGIYGFLNMITAFIYSLFAHGRVVDRVFSDDLFYENSICHSVLDKTARSMKKSKFSQTMEWLIEKSVPLQVLGAVRSFLSRLSLNVYGVFSVVFGLASIFTYFIVTILGGGSAHGISAVFVAAGIVICSVPMLMSQRSASSYISESRFLRGFAVFYLGVPEEKLKTDKKLGSKGYAFFSAALGLVCGGLTYFWHPSYILIVAAIIIAVSLISGNPESGVLMTAIAIPFLQYTDYAELILLGFVIITSISYISKLVRHRRVITFTAESVTVLIFCGFILAASLFSAGGTHTLIEALVTVVIILGGFFTTYNLMRGDKLLSAYSRILGVSFSLLAVVGVWNVLYDAVVDGVMYSIHDYVQPILEGNNIYIADSAEVFGVFAILAFPLVFSGLARQKGATKKVPWLILISVLVTAVFIYGTYETVVAILIEFCLFWALYSHKTLNVVLIALIPLGIVTILFPYIANSLGLHSLGEEIGALMPLGFPDAPSYRGVVDSTLQMLGDGNLTGIGVGEHAYTSAMQGYTDAVSSGAVSPANFWLQVICWSGLGGIVTFIIFLALTFRSGIGYLASSRDREIRINALALFCGLTTLLVFGSVNCIWNDMRMLYLFWATAGLFVGYVRTGIDLEKKTASELMREDDRSDVDLRFYE